MKSDTFDHWRSNWSNVADLMKIYEILWKYVECIRLPSDFWYIWPLTFQVFEYIRSDENQWQWQSTKIQWTSMKIFWKSLKLQTPDTFDHSHITHIITYYHILPHFSTYYHILTDMVTYYYIFPPITTYFHILQHILTDYQRFPFNVKIGFQKWAFR